MSTQKPTYSPFSVLIIFVCLCIAGASLLPLLNVQLNPSRSLPQITISYGWSDASARVIEQEVTSKLEAAISTLQGIKKVSSQTKRGSGNITIEYKKGSDLDLARFEVANLIRQVYNDLPSAVGYPHISLNSAGNNNVTVLSYRIIAPSSASFIQDYVVKKISPSISLIDGVGSVNVYGAQPFEWNIETNPSSLKALNITNQEVSNIISTYLRDESLGNAILDSATNGLHPVKLAYSTTQTPDWSKLPIKQVGGRIIWLTDIANVRLKERPPSQYYRVNGLNMINLVISADKGSNQIKLAKDVKGKIEELRAGLPNGYAILLSYDASEYLDKELNTIIKRTLFSLGLLLLFVIIISRQVRYVMLILVSLLFNLIIACLFYYLFRLEIHLYSLAGITISFGIVVDNTIIMVDHYRYYKDRQVFIAILAATLTTIGALSIIFVLDEQQKINLLDFALVIITNLFISLVIALWMIPAMMHYWPLKSKKGRTYIRRKKLAYKLTNWYGKSIRFSKRFKWAYFIVLIVGFGIPIHWLPSKIEQEGFWSNVYNKSLGGDTFQNDIKPTLEKVLGGGLRLFTEYVFETSYYSEPQRTTLTVRGNMPEGCTIQQLNEAIKKMEQFISEFDEVEMFETAIYSYDNSSIRILFKPEYEYGSFPYILKSRLESKAISLGGMDWGVFGVGRGFSNALYNGMGGNRIVLEGYNYDDLYRYATILKDSLLENPRIKEVTIAGSDGWNFKVFNEYTLELNNHAIASQGVSNYSLYNIIKEQTFRNHIGQVYSEETQHDVILLSSGHGDYDLWQLNNEPLIINNSEHYFKSLGAMKKQRTGNEIFKENQQYKLIAVYDFIGPATLADRVRKKQIEQISSILPMGYTVKENDWGYWNRKDQTQYYLIFIVIAIIYFICAILLESLSQPLAIISMIPVSFIGVFVTFYFFDVNFDQGGYASFIMLSGLTVNSALFIINDYNKRGVYTLKGYLKAFNFKITPILLTLISTMLGLVPFIWQGQEEVFWYSFASGTIGGLIFSVLAILIYLPLFMKIGVKPTTAPPQA